MSFSHLAFTNPAEGSGKRCKLTSRFEEEHGPKKAFFEEYLRLESILVAMVLVVLAHLQADASNRRTTDKNWLSPNAQR